MANTWFGLDEEGFYVTKHDLLNFNRPDDAVRYEHIPFCREDKQDLEDLRESQTDTNDAGRFDSFRAQLARRTRLSGSKLDDLVWAIETVNALVLRWANTGHRSASGDIENEETKETAPAATDKYNQSSGTHKSPPEEAGTDKARPKTNDDAIQRWEAAACHAFQQWRRECQMRGVDLDMSRVFRLAIYNNCLSIVRDIVDKGQVDLSDFDSLGRTALTYAARPEQWPMMNYLLQSLQPEKRAKTINHPGIDGRSALHWAIDPKLPAERHSRSQRTVRALLYYGSNAGLTSLDLSFIDDNRHLRTDDEAWRQEVWCNCAFAVLARSSKLSDPQKLACVSIRGRMPRKDCTKEYPNSFNISILSLWQGLFGMGTDKLMVEEIEGRMSYEESSWSTESGPGFSWIHILSTNGFLVAVIADLFRESQTSSFREKNKRMVEFVLDGIVDPSSLPSDNFLMYREPSYECADSLGDPDNPAYFTLVFPCLVLDDTDQFLQKRGSSTPQAANARNMTYWTVKQETPKAFTRFSLHVERTLDEAYYPGWKPDMLNKRNSEQVVTREFVKSQPSRSSYMGKRPILMVPQLWVWGFPNCIFSATSMTQNSDAIESISLLPPLDSEVWQKGWELHIEAMWPKLHAALLVADHVENFSRGTQNGFPPPLDIFETGVVRVLADVDLYSDPSLAEVNVHQEREFLNDIADIRNELAMIQDVFSQQLEVVQAITQDIQMEAAAHLQNDPTGDKRDLVKRAYGVHGVILKHVKRAEKIDRDAERIEKMIQDLLNLKRTHASMQDARTGLILNTAVIGFTVVTIVFTPLAWITSLFALEQYKEKYHGGWLALAEITTLFFTAFVIVIAIWATNRWSESKSSKKVAKGRTSASPSYGSRWGEHGSKGARDPSALEEKNSTADESHQAVSSAWRWPRKMASIGARQRRSDDTEAGERKASRN